MAAHPVVDALTPSPAPPPLDVETLYRRYAGVVYRRVLSFYRPQEAEEILQEVFIKVIERWDAFRGESSPVTWLYRITTNHCLTRLRDQKNRQRLLAQHFEVMGQEASEAIGADDKLLLEQIWRALPEELLDYAVYYFLDGLTHAQIGELMGVSRRTVGNRLQEVEAYVRAL